MIVLLMSMLCNSVYADLLPGKTFLKVKESSVVIEDYFSGYHPLMPEYETLESAIGTNFKVELGGVFQFDSTVKMFSNGERFRLIEFQHKIIVPIVRWLDFYYTNSQTRGLGYETEQMVNHGVGVKLYLYTPEPVRLPKDNI